MHPDRHRPHFKAYQTQMFNARYRGIEFKLTYAQWLRLWIKSGHLKDRGRLSHQYCMSRHADSGAYEVGNVCIITNKENAELNYKRRTQSPAEKAKRSKTITTWWRARKQARR